MEEHQTDSVGEGTSCLDQLGPSNSNQSTNINAPVKTTSDRVDESLENVRDRPYTVMDERDYGFARRDSQNQRGVTLTELEEKFQKYRALKSPMRRVCDPVKDIGDFTACDFMEHKK